jgi:hypothetical protein
MIDFAKLQNDLAHVLCGDSWLGNVNIVTRWKLLLDDVKRPDREMMIETLAYLTPRNGRKGCGIIVEIPELSVASPNLPGPEFDLSVVCLVLEDPLTNYGPQTGTLKPADQVAQRIIEVGHNWSLMPHGQLYAKGASIVPAQDFEPLRAFRARLNLKMPRTQTDRVAPVAISEADGLITLTVPDGVTAYYSTDGSFPGPANPAARIYDAPVAVEVGSEFRWCAYQDGKLPSFAEHATVT